MSVDQYHEGSDRIVQIMEHQQYDSGVTTTVSTPGILARTLKEEIPEFEYASNYSWMSEFLFTKDDMSFREIGLYVENDFFQILTIDLIYGDRESLLMNPNSIVLSEYMAKKYFGDSNPIGKAITIDNDQVLTVTGVFRNMPDNSTFQFDCLLRYDDWLLTNKWATQWDNNGPSSIAKLQPGVDLILLNEKIINFIKDRDEESNVDLFVYPFTERYLKGQFENRVVAGGRIEYVRLFTIVAIFILLIACINFMNLSTAKAAKRAKEVGIRKSIGASRGSLVGQFIGESMLISFFSLFISILFVELCLPFFNSLTEKSISVDYTDPFLIFIFIGTVIVTGFVSGSYPAFYLSSMEAVKTLKGSLKSSWKEVFARKTLVVFQFSLSIILIFSTIIIYRQIQFTQTHNIGYVKENLIYFNTVDQVGEQWESFKDRVTGIPGVLNISRTTHTFLNRYSTTSDITWQGKDPEARIRFENFFGDYELFETMGIEIAEGRNFSENFGSDSSKIILNETAVKITGFEQPIGKVISLWGEDYEIIGVVKDFHFQSLRTEISPLIIRLNPTYGWRAFVRIESANINNTLSQIEKEFKSYNPSYPFDYHFMDEQYGSLYRAEMRIGNLARIFSIIAIFISCLGLFGLSIFSAEQRSKEIGIRKVLGASVQAIVGLLSKDFTKLVLISIAISTPISWYLMKQWITDYAYSIGIEWWVFMAAGIAALFIAWLTVSWQSVKTALKNPIESLKSE